MVNKLFIKLICLAVEMLSMVLINFGRIFSTNHGAVADFAISNSLLIIASFSAGGVIISFVAIFEKVCCNYP